MRKIDLKTWPTEKISIRVLYLLVAVVAVVFIAFALIGFSRPYDDNPEFNAPLLTDVVLVLMYLLFFGPLGVAIWSLVKGLKYRGERVVNGVPARKIAVCVAGGTLLLLLLTFLFGSSDAIVINGKPYETWAWLKLADMIDDNSIVLIVVAVATVVYGNMKYIRKKHV